MRNAAPPVRLAIHGGAGDLDLAQHDTQAERAALRAIAADGLRLLRDGASSLDVVEQLVMQLEDCPLFNAGVGAVLNAEGAVELDAAIVDGDGRRYGAVAAVQSVKNPVRLARAVMDRTAHALFAGAAADRLNVALGLPAATAASFITEARRRQWREAQRSGGTTLDHDSSFGTVGAVARDARGHLAAATSTGGLNNQRAGRIGDTPILGAGTFADDRSVAMSCTGTGESFLRAGCGFVVDAQLRGATGDLDTACLRALAEVEAFGGRGGLIAIDRHGELALPFTTRAMFRAWVDIDGRVRVAVGADEDQALSA